MLLLLPLVRRRVLAGIFLVIFPCWSLADVVVSTQVIRPRSVITAEVLGLRDAVISGTFADTAQVIGQEARVALYPGRPIRFGDVGPPALIERNQLVQLVFQTSVLTIKTGGRSLGRAAIGDMLRVMNLASRSTVVGIVQADRTVLVQQ
ncbi:flagellar basal body P-ring formation chaperone FlgA [Cognatishimia sp. WU-CL00825]|uniref:flagellar basal body P-ring formation chaperone FlgA n=1 Tax=Cognatishimia sp. WU-CL00825 TaxID=3127658 RepID=UPI0031061B56